MRILTRVLLAGALGFAAAAPAGAQTAQRSYENGPAFGSTVAGNKAAVKREDIRVLHGGVSARELVFPK